MLSIDQIEERLRPISEDIVRGHLKGWDRWRTLIRERPEFTRPLGRSARANFVHPHICREIEELVAPRGYHLNRALAFLALAVGDDLLVRFKYLRGSRPHNVTTKQQRLLRRQLYSDEMMESLAFEGFTKPPTNVTAGYTLDPNEENIAHVFVLRECVGYLPQKLDLYPVIRVVADPLQFPNIPDVRPARIASDEEIPAEGAPKDERP